MRPSRQRLRSSRARADGLVGRYLRDLRAYPRIRASDEIALAQTIAQNEISAWRSALSHSALIGPAHEIVTQQLQSPPSFAEVERAARRAERSQRPTDRRKLQNAASQLAERLRECDPDHRALDAVVANVDRLRDDSPNYRELEPHQRAIRRDASTAARARQAFVEANLRLVVHIASGYARHGIPIDDLIQDGNLGLIKAVDRFDYRLGFRFSTYASWWINHAISRALANTSRLVRLPVHVREANQHAARAASELSQALGRTPTDEEVAKALDISVAKLHAVRNFANRRVVSIDAPAGEDETAVRLEVLSTADEDHTTFDEVATRRVIDKLRRHLEILSRQETDIIERHFGLRGGREQTLQEIGRSYGLSRERIRQVERRALTRLRRLLERVELMPGAEERRQG